mmetsp:Transcript_5758/g.14650  ORF Transcript_5758/g.14650 Transcript_5758/m.14650 type:complete len:328 (+) Transcript_5758:236-1219(+)
MELTVVGVLKTAAIPDAGLIRSEASRQEARLVDERRVHGKRRRSEHTGGDSLLRRDRPSGDTIALQVLKATGALLVYGCGDEGAGAAGRVRDGLGGAGRRLLLRFGRRLLCLGWDGRCLLLSTGGRRGDDTIGELLLVGFLGGRRGRRRRSAGGRFATGHSRWWDVGEVGALVGQLVEEHRRLIATPLAALADVLPGGADLLHDRVVEDQPAARDRVVEVGVVVPAIVADHAAQGVATGAFGRREHVFDVQLQRDQIQCGQDIAHERLVTLPGDAHRKHVWFTHQIAREMVLGFAMIFIGTTSSILIGNVEKETAKRKRRFLTVMCS